MSVHRLKDWRWHAEQFRDIDRAVQAAIEGREPEQFGYATPEEHAIADMQYPADVEPPGER